MVPHLTVQIWWIERYHYEKIEMIKSGSCVTLRLITPSKDGTSPLGYFYVWILVAISPHGCSFREITELNKKKLCKMFFLWINFRLFNLCLVSLGIIFHQINVKFIWSWRKYSDFSIISIKSWIIILQFLVFHLIHWDIFFIKMKHCTNQAILLHSIIQYFLYEIMSNILGPSWRIILQKNIFERV